MVALIALSVHKTLAMICYIQVKSRWFVCPAQDMQRNARGNVNNKESLEATMKTWRWQLIQRMLKYLCMYVYSNVYVYWYVYVYSYACLWTQWNAKSCNFIKLKSSALLRHSPQVTASNSSKSVRKILSLIQWVVK